MNSDDLAARGVRVKALIWLDVDHVYPDGSGRKLSMANGLLGLRYDIYETPQEGLHVVGPDGFAIYNMPSVQAAKAAAQADYEARILAALEEDAPDAGTQALAELRAERDQHKGQRYIWEEAYHEADNRTAIAEADRARLAAELAEAKAQVAGFREAITDARDNCPEVNLRNYDADDVERMNDAAGRVYDILNAALAAAEGAKG